MPQKLSTNMKKSQISTFCFRNVGTKRQGGFFEHMDFDIWKEDPCV